MPTIISEIWGPWLWFAGTALGLATVLVSLIYVLSGLFMSDRMKTWAKMELTEIFYSAIIIAVVMGGGLPTIDGVVQGALGVEPGGGTVPGDCYGAGGTSAWILTTDQGIFGQQQQYRCLNICGGEGNNDLIAQSELSVYHDVDACHMRLGIWYLREVFNECKDLAFDVYIDYIKTSMIAEFTINIEFLFEKAGFFTFTPWRGFYTMGNTVKEVVFDWAMKIMTITKFQEVMLRFIAVALFPALFVIGVILRTFTFTRRLGGLLLGMAIALYFIFPAFYAFGALVMLDIKGKAYNDWINNDEANPNNIPNPPIANTIYLTGEFDTVGGDGKFSYDEAKDQLRVFEGQTFDETMQKIEEGDTDYTIRFDMSKKEDDIEELQGLTEEEKEELKEQKMKEAREAGDSWFSAVSAISKVDQFVEFAWEPGGPVESLSRITFWSLFFSLFSIIGTIAAIRSLSITFGGDIEIAGLTRLI